MKNDLAPIALSTYSRIGHLKKNIEALQKNELAEESELYIFSDAAKAGDEKKVQAVRDYLKTVDGFKKVYIYEREENNRVENNRGGMRMLLDKYERIIFIEEDVVTSPYFLRFMNDALRIYKDDDRILAITAYAPPIDYPQGYDFDIGLGKRAFCWAFAIWKKQYELIEMDIKKNDYLKLRLNPFLSSKYKQAGENVILQLRNIAYSRIEALDIRMDYTMFKHDKFVLYPRFSMIQSTGLDGSGENWLVGTNKFDVSLADRRLNVIPKVNPNIDIMCAMAAIRKCTFNQKLALWLADFGLLDWILYLRSKLRGGL